MENMKAVQSTTTEARVLRFEDARANPEFGELLIRSCCLG